MEVLSLVDNTIDYLSSIDQKEVLDIGKWTKEKGVSGSRLPVATHGFSMLVRVFRNGEEHVVLFDTGPDSRDILSNAERMGVDLADVEAIVMSHGHWDHAGGLTSAAKAIGKKDLPIIVHEDMFKTRGMAKADGTVRKHRAFPPPEQVEPAKYLVAKAPHLLADDTVLVTGEIPRQTNFEKGLPEHRTLTAGKWVPEPLLRDDRAIVVNVKGKGLVVLSGCGHAGIINTILHAKRLTSIEEVYAVLGGFHLAGKAHEAAIKPTVEALKHLSPKLIAPSHCTGWRAMYAIHEAMPKAFVWNSVGNLYTLQTPPSAQQSRN